MRTSLLRRMILAQGLVVALLWLLMVGFILVIAYGLTGLNVVDMPMRIQAATLLNLLQDEKDPARFRLQAHRLQELAETYPQFSEPKHPGYRPVFQILDGKGALLFRTDAAPETVLTRAGPGIHNLLAARTPWRVLVVEDRPGGLRVLVAESLAERRREAWMAILQQSPVQLLVLFLVLAACTWLVSRRALKPLRELAEAVGARSPADLTPLAGHTDLLETRPLVAALNRLFRQVQTLLETQRRFVADAAHELRTPLAVIAAQAHVLQHAQDPAQRDGAAQELQQGVERGAQAVRQLLSVARLEATGPVILDRPLDLASLARERVASLVPQALAKDQDLGYEGPDSLSWEGDAGVLGSAIDNLLVNALLYTPPGGRITLRVAPGVGAILLTVEDTGPGIPPEFLAVAFERFTRLPGTQEAGSGLGLAIVRRAVELLGGTVVLEGRPEGSGLRATLRLPRREP